MKFVCNGLVLSEAVMKVSKACGVRTPAPIMEYIKITAGGEFAFVKRLHIRARVGIADKNPVFRRCNVDFLARQLGNEIGKQFTGNA